MKRGLNKTQLIGNVGREDARLGKLPDQVTPVLNFTFAVNDYYTDRNTGEEITTTDWYRIAIFGDRAKALAQYITSGIPLYLEGKVKAKAWQPADDAGKSEGKPLAELTLRVKELLFLDGRKQTEDFSGEVEGEAFPVDVHTDLFP